MRMKLNRLKLRDIVKAYEIREQEFEYAGTKGIAELLGWQIVSFRKENDPNNTIAVSFSEIEGAELTNIANLILEFMEIDIRFGDSVTHIVNVYGQADFTDMLYEDMVRYNYLVAPDFFIVFGIKDGMLFSLEMIADEEMIQDVICVRNDVV